MAVAVFDTELRYIAASARWYCDYRLEEVEIIGRRHYEIFPEVPERWRRIHERNLAGEAMSCDEDPFPRADGTVDYIRWKNVPWLQPTGEIGGLIMYTEVVTENVETKKKIESQNVQLRELQEKERWHADHDFLTALPNRRYLRRASQQIIRQLRQVDGDLSAFHIDLDHFKRVNDTLGHAAGDAVLALAGERLKDALPTLAVLARVGGDEFVAIAPTGAVRNEATGIALRLIEALRPPFEVQGRSLKLGASVGIATASLQELEKSEDLEPLIERADEAMYEAKRAGRLQAFTYDKDLAQRSRERAQLAEELFQGIDGDQFEPHFQPQVDAQSHKLIGVEALARWRHPTRGLLTPVHFLDRAEELGVMDQIDDVIFEKSAREAMELERRLDRPLRLSVNISMQRLERDDFALRSLAFGGPEGGLALEVLETVLYDGDELNLADKFATLRRAGLEIHLDDFGSGHASLVGMLEIQPDCIKLDRSLVNSTVAPRKRLSIIEHTIKMAHEFDIRVLAEGVETGEAALALAELGADELQGFYFGRPMRPSALEAWLISLAA